MAAEPIPVRDPDPASNPRVELVGRPGAPGRAVGRAYRPGAATVDEALADGAGGLRRTASTRTPDDEAERLRAALDRAAKELESLATSAGERAGAEVGAIFEAQALFARDPGLIEPSLAAIADGARAEDALEGVASGLADQLAGIDDDYFRARAADVRDVARRVVATLTGRGAPVLHRSDGEPAVVARRRPRSSLVAGLRPELVAGLALGGGAPTGHTAIVARALGVPLVLGLGPASDGIPVDIEVLVDGTLGRIVVAPSDDDRRTLAATRDGGPAPRPRSGRDRRALPRRSRSRRTSARCARPRRRPASVQPASAWCERSCCSSAARSRPGLDEQRSVYRRIAETFPMAPVVFRTLDIGGDKPAPWSTDPPEMKSSARGPWRAPGAPGAGAASTQTAGAARGMRRPHPRRDVADGLEPR